MKRHSKIPTAADRAELTRLAIEAVKHNPDPAYWEEVHRRSAQLWREREERADEHLLKAFEGLTPLPPKPPYKPAIESPPLAP
jgi:hypothetical protein